MGPEATADIYQKIIKICQKKYWAKLDRDYPKILISSIPAPQIIENLKYREKLLRMLIDNLKKLESSGADLIILACNTAHYLLPELEKIASIPILNIVEEVARKVNKANVEKIGLLATTTTIKQKLYEREFKKYGKKLILPDKNSQNKIVKIIKNIIAGRKLVDDKIKLKKIIRNLKIKGAAAVILGCTDLPIIIEKDNFDVDIFDCNEIIAEAAVDKSYCE